MAKPTCDSYGTLAGADKYSSPVPIIGLYIAGGSLVCLILILCDVCSGFRCKKLWIPCRFFSLNSFTLTLIGIATKIPVDLTTAMPSAEDQLSKLTGTIFVCVTMCFVLPSLGTKGDSENNSNIAALSLSVIAVIVNVCMQMATGVIFSFVVEHSIILFLMLWLLVVEFWCTVINLKCEKYNSDSRKESIKGIDNPKYRLYMSYIYGYSSSPQLLLCKDQFSGNVAIVCTSCSVVLLEAIFRVLVFGNLKFCGGDSDYKWSIWLVVVIQILIVVVVGLAVVSRWITYVTGGVTGGETLGKTDYDQLLYVFASKRLPASLGACFRYIVYFAACIRLLLSLPNARFASTISILLRKYRRREFQWRREFQCGDSINRDLLGQCDLRWSVDPRMLGKAIEDMAHCIEKNAHDFPRHLVKLLSSVPVPEVRNNRSVFWSDLSCISLILLAEMAKLSEPTSLTMRLTNILVEVFDDIYFIDSQVNMPDSGSSIKFMNAKLIWKYGLIRPIVIEHLLKKSRDAIGNYPLSFRNTSLREEAEAILQIIDRQSYASSNGRYYYMEKLFVYMLRLLLAPSRMKKAIFKYISDSPMAEYEDRVRYGFRMYCKYEGVESLLSSSVPSQLNVTEQHGRRPSSDPGTSFQNH